MRTAIIILFAMIFIQCKKEDPKPSVIDYTVKFSLDSKKTKDSFNNFTYTINPPSPDGIIAHLKKYSTHYDTTIHNVKSGTVVSLYIFKDSKDTTIARIDYNNKFISASNHDDPKKPGFAFATITLP